MGTEITLQVAGVGLDWSKNSIGIDHGQLFQDGDQARRRCDQISYDAADGNTDDDWIALNEAVFARSLNRTLPRLNLLGHTLEVARQEYEHVVAEAKSSREALAPFLQQGSPPPDFMDFQDYCFFACRRPLLDLASDSNMDAERKDFKASFPGDEHLLKRVPHGEGNDMFWSERSYFGATTCILSAYSMLQVFGTSAANLDAEVVWEFGALVGSGWASLDDFQPGIQRQQTFLIATEGTSDARILKHGLDLLKPDVSDFFRFIDVNERHPFSGTGNLMKFAEGLIRIDVQNQVIVLLDNDAEGVDVHEKLTKLGMPPNMRVTVLPDDPSFEKFPTRGPDGIFESDINGRAAAIECYLDLNLTGRPPAQVLWSNYKKDVGRWQGALEFKESYVDGFLGLRPETCKQAGYDLSKISKVLGRLIDEATGLSSAA